MSSIKTFNNEIFTSNLNVGIGTRTPFQKLHVEGISYLNGNVGIGTTNSRGRLEVNGHILPSFCNVYDLGSSNLRFRDLYISGRTLNMEGLVMQSGQDGSGMNIFGNLTVHGSVGRWKAFPRDNGGIIAFYYTSVLGRDGRIYHSGRSDSYSAGNYGSDGNAIAMLRMAAMPSEETVTMFACTNASKMALTASNKIYVWGKGQHAILGLGNTNDALGPTELSTVADQIIDIQFSNNETGGNTETVKHAGYLTATGRLFLWGYNAHGQTGNGTTTTPVTTPYEVPKISSIEWGGFEAQCLATFAWTSDADGRRLYACGRNSQGCLGIGNVTDGANITSMTPCIRLNDNVQLSDIKKIRQPNNWVNTATSCTIVLTNEGELYTTGYNGSGQLGNGNTTNQNKFVGPVLTNVKDFAIGRSGNVHSIFAVKNDGTLWVWGHNSHEVFGTGGVIAVDAVRNTPYQVIGITDAYGLYGPQLPGYGSMFLQRNDKSWWFAGQPYLGLGGLRDNVRYNSWTKVQMPEEIIQICCFRCWHLSTNADIVTTLMLGTSGKLWGCGHNGYGELGNGYHYSIAAVNYTYILPAYGAFSG
jgi:alpha-tubulin suppressor-like RCC1 family protein